MPVFADRRCTRDGGVTHAGPIAGKQRAMEFPQTHQTSDGRPIEVDRSDDGTVTFSGDGARLATLTPTGGGEWRLAPADGETTTLHAAQDDPPIAAVVVQLDARAGRPRT
jgi:hypothetical protein